MLRVVTRPFTKVFIFKSPVGKQKQKQRNKQETNKQKAKTKQKTKQKQNNTKQIALGFSLTACAKLSAFLLH